MPDHDGPSTDADSTPTHQMSITAAVDVRLATFSSTDALAWFQRAEIIFRTKRVSSSNRLADFMLAALPEDVFPRLSTWLLSKGDEDLEYQEVKTNVLQMFTATPEERAEKLLLLSKLPLATQRPSAAFQEVRAVATLPDARQIDLL